MLMQQLIKLVTTIMENVQFVDVIKQELVVNVIRMMIVLPLFAVLLITLVLNIQMVSQIKVQVQLVHKEQKTMVALAKL